MPGMRRITAILLWLVAAGATAVVAWSAVSLAGDQVADRPVRPLSADEVARLPGAGAAVTTPAPVDAEPASATTRATAPTATPSSRPSPGSSTSTTVAAATRGSRPSSGSTPTSAGAAATAPTTTSSSASSSTTTTSTTSTTSGPAAPTTTTTAPAATTTSAPAPAPAPAPQAYSLVGGRVVVVAEAGQVRLVSASPNPGFSMEVAASGPDEVRVRFDGEDHRSELRARWQGGRLDVDIDEG